MKKITAIILVVLLAISLVGCGGNGEEEIKKISTVEEMDAEIEANWDYKALGYIKEKDDFSESYIISNSDPDEGDELKLYENMKNGILDMGTHFVYGEDTEQNLGCVIFSTCLIRTKGYPMFNPDVFITNGEKTLKIESDYVDISPDDFDPLDTKYIFNILTITFPNTSDIETLTELQNSSEPLKIRCSFNESNVSINDQVLSDNSDKEFKEVLGQYLSLYGKCDIEKVQFGA